MPESLENKMIRSYNNSLRTLCTIIGGINLLAGISVLGLGLSIPVVATNDETGNLKFISGIEIPQEAILWVILALTGFGSIETFLSYMLITGTAFRNASRCRYWLVYRKICLVALLIGRISYGIHEKLPSDQLIPLNFLIFSFVNIFIFKLVDAFITLQREEATAPVPVIEEYEVLNQKMITCSSSRKSLARATLSPPIPDKTLEDKSKRKTRSSERISKQSRETKSEAGGPSKAAQKAQPTRKVKKNTVGGFPVLSTVMEAEKGAPRNSTRKTRAKIVAEEQEEFSVRVFRRSTLEQRATRSNSTKNNRSKRAASTFN